MTVRNGTNSLTILMTPDQKERMQEIVAHIPYEMMTSFARRALQREMDIYEEDPEAYKAKYVGT